MSCQTLKERFEAAQSAANPFSDLYSVAESLRDIGLPQTDIYCIFVDFYRRHENDDLFSDTIADVLDCIWGGRLG